MVLMVTTTEAQTQMRRDLHRQTIVLSFRGRANQPAVPTGAESCERNQALREAGYYG
jgi:hypothetical protein